MQIAINAYGGKPWNESAYLASWCEGPSCQCYPEVFQDYGGGFALGTSAGFTAFFCDGTPNPAQSRGCNSCAGRFAAGEGECAEFSAGGQIKDQRSPGMVTASCCPASLLPQGPPVPCVTIAEFRTDRRLINSSAGEEVNFQGNLTANGETSVDWTLKIAGRTFSGSGNSVRAVWDGKDVSGKQVDPGDYTARLQVKASGVCRGSAAKEIEVKVAPSEEDLCLDAAF